MRTRIWTWIAIFFTFFPLGSLITPSLGSDKGPSQNGIAVVNGSVIPKADLDREIHHMKKRYAEEGKDLTDSRLENIKEATLERLIVNELMYQESQKMGIQADEASVDWQFTATRDSHETQEKFEGWLKEMNLSEAGLKAQIRRRDTIDLLISKAITEKVTVSEKEIKEYYSAHLDHFKQPEEVRASHILIKVDPQAKDAERVKARKALEKIQSELKKGKDFSALAKEYSQCPSSANGGDLGYLMRGFMAEPFEKVAFGLKPGEISDIVETEFGYHLIKVTEKKPEYTIPYEDAKERARQLVKHEKTEQEFVKYIDKLKEKATIERLVKEAP